LGLSLKLVGSIWGEGKHGERNKVVYSFFWINLSIFPKLEHEIPHIMARKSHITTRFGI
jgi:hypothetical protein